MVTRSSVIIGIVVLVLVVASITGLAYCYQQELNHFPNLAGFVLSLLVLFGAAGSGIAYFTRLAMVSGDEYARNLADSAMKTARESAEDTVERLPETLLEGLEKTVERARGRVFGRSKYQPPVRRRLPYRYEDEDDVDRKSSRADEHDESESDDHTDSDDFEGRREDRDRGSSRSFYDDITDRRRKRRRPGL
ncbi:MAG: hypothetical protein SVY53_12285 [Chloroflexota bacterium]|nr:hypothetical protein [Chloroflexota bacterium]